MEQVKADINIAEMKIDSLKRSILQTDLSNIYSESDFQEDMRSISILIKLLTDIREEI